MSFEIRRLSDRKRSSSPVWRRFLIAALAAARPLAQWWLRRMEIKKEEDARSRRVHLLQRILLIICAVLLSFVLLSGIARGLVALKVLSLNSVIAVTAGTLPADRYGHTNILLMGAGDVTHEGVDLTDSIMVASIDPTTQSVALLSLPRDLYFLSTENMGKGRINSLYRDYKYYLIGKKGMKKDAASIAALNEFAKEVGAALGVEIHGVLKVDFVAFVQAVDALGGVDVVVPRDLTDPEYPGPNYTYETFSITAGPHHLDGETALKYARSRHSTSDFDRSARQQQMITALTDNIRSQGLLTHPSRLLSLLNIVQQHVEMTFDLRTLLAIAKAGLDVDRNNILGLQLNTQNGLFSELSAPGGLLYSPPRDQFEGASVLLPVSIPEFPVTWKQIHLLVHLFLDARTPSLARRPIAILNAGAKNGSGRRLAAELTRFNFIVDRTENAGIPDQPSSFIAQQDIDPATEEFMSTLLGLPLLPTPAGLSADKTAPITIILGKNYTYRPLQDLVH